MRFLDLINVDMVNWYPGSGEVLDCIDSGSFAPLLTLLETLYKVISCHCKSKAFDY